MAEMVSSAVVGETVNRIISRLVGMDEEKSQQIENIERLEMAHIKIEAAVNMANKWQITDVPLLRWRSKLKRAAQECDITLRRCKQRVLEEEEIRQRKNTSSFPRRIALNTKSFISSLIDSTKDEFNHCSANIRRFERFADGADDFLKFIQFGGTPRTYMFFDPLIGHLLTGKFLRYQAFQGSTFHYLGIRPMSFAERGVEAILGFFSQDLNEPTKCFSLGLMLRLSESTDIFNVIMKCMQSVAPHFKFEADGVKRELIQLPTQDFSWAPHCPYDESEYWVNVQTTLTQRYRPNPLCCTEDMLNSVSCSSTGEVSSSTGDITSPSSKLLSGMFPEEVIAVFLQFHVSLSDQHTNSERNSLNQGMPLKLGILFLPHDTPEDIKTAADDCVLLEVKDEMVEERVYRNAWIQDVDEKLLPKAIDYLCQNRESKMYQMCLKSSHGTAHLCMEKTNASMCKTYQTRVSDKRVVQQQGICGVKGWKEASRDLLKFWSVCSSDKMQGSIRFCTVKIEDL